MSYKLNTNLVNTEAIVEEASSQISDVANNAVSEIVAPVYSYDYITFGTEGNFETSCRGLLTWDEGVAYQNHPTLGNVTQIKPNKGFKVKAAAGAEITVKFYSGYGQDFIVDGVRVTSDTYTTTVTADKEIYVTTDNASGSYIKEFDISKLKSSINDVLFNGIGDLKLHGLYIGYDRNRNASNGIVNYGNALLRGDLEAESRQPADYNETRDCVARINVDSNSHGGAKFSSCVYDKFDHFAKFKISSGFDYGDGQHLPLVELVASYNDTLDDDYSQFKMGTTYAKLETYRETGDEVNQIIDLGSSDATKMILSVEQEDDDGSNIITKVILGSRELELYVDGPKDESVFYEHRFKMSALDERPKFSNDGGNTWHRVAFLDDFAADVQLRTVYQDDDGPGGLSGDSSVLVLNFELQTPERPSTFAGLAAKFAAGSLSFKNGTYDTDSGGGEPVAHSYTIESISAMTVDEDSSTWGTVTIIDTNHTTHTVAICKDRSWGTSGSSS